MVTLSVFLFSGLYRKFQRPFRQSPRSGLLVAVRVDVRCFCVGSESLQDHESGSVCANIQHRRLYRHDAEHEE
jgi:hypothetical protein